VAEEDAAMRWGVVAVNGVVVAAAVAEARVDVADAEVAVDAAAVLAVDVADAEEAAVNAAAASNRTEINTTSACPCQQRLCASEQKQ